MCNIGLLAVSGSGGNPEPLFLYASKRATCSALVSFANSLLVMEHHPLWVAPLHLLTSSLCLYYTTNFVVCQQESNIFRKLFYEIRCNSMASMI